MVRNLLRKQVNKRPSGPSAEKRKSSRTLVWGEVRNAGNESMSAKIICSDGYTFTAHSSLIIIDKILKGHFKPGYQTPASMYGEDLVLQVPGTVRDLTVDTNDV